jgi:hypothetical protein
LDRFPLNAHVVLNTSAVLIQKTDATYSKSNHKWLQTNPRNPKDRQMYAETTVMVFCDVLLSSPLLVCENWNMHMERYE